MDIYTKLVFINMACFLTLLVLDAYWFNDWIEKTKIVCIVADVWALLSILSLPAIVIYWIVLF